MFPGATPIIIVGPLMRFVSGFVLHGNQGAAARSRRVCQVSIMPLNSARPFVALTALIIPEQYFSEGRVSTRQSEEVPRCHLELAKANVVTSYYIIPEFPRALEVFAGGEIITKHIYWRYVGYEIRLIQRCTQCSCQLVTSRAVIPQRIFVKGGRIRC